LRIKGQAAVLTDAKTGECVGYDFRVTTDCENSIGDCDGSPEELFGTAWRPEVTDQPERATEWPDGVYMIGRKKGNDLGGGFEEDSGSEVVNTGWWLAPVEMPLFDGRHVPNPVVAFPESGVQVPAAIKLDRGVVAIAIFFRKHAAGDRTRFVRKLVPFIEDRIRDPKPMRRE
jgi:hypothetical protein